MKLVKILLVVVLSITAILQALWGLWMFADLESVGKIFLGVTSDTSILNSKEILLLTRVLAKSFLMLAVFSGVTVFSVITEKPMSMILSMACGICITLISVTTFIETSSITALLTDFIRGFLIIVLTVILYRGKRVRKEGLV